MTMTTNKKAPYSLTNEVVKWTKEFLGSCGATKAVIGISGGKDSSVCAAICVKALGKENVLGVLMPNGEQKDLLIRNDDDTLSPTKIIHYLANDRMTNVNLDFSSEVCYEGLKSMTESLETETPKGLKVFTSSCATIYPFLSSLPEKARNAWFGFDHYYSDNVFSSVLPILFRERHFRHINDIGGNTGKFALAATAFSDDTRVTIIDLPQQCELAAANIREHGLEDRIDTCPVNILEESARLPSGGDLWWMSQFLDCFSSEQIEEILTMVYNAMDDSAMVAINEVFGDRQSNDIAGLVIEANSLYFTVMANGVSRFYHSDVFIRLVEKIGFKVHRMVEHVGLAHTLLILTK